MAKKRVRRLSFQELLLAAKGAFDIDIEADLTEAESVDAEARTSGILTKSEVPATARDSHTKELEDRLAAIEKALNVQVTPPVEAKAETKVEEAAEEEPEPNDETVEGTKAVTPDEMVSMKAAMVSMNAAMTAQQEQMATMAAQLAQAIANFDALQKEAAKNSKKRAEAAASTSVLTPEMTAFLQQQVAAQKSAEKTFAFDSIQD